jgi:hypothetical protein
VNAVKAAHRHIVKALMLCQGMFLVLLALCGASNAAGLLEKGRQLFRDIRNDTAEIRGNAANEADELLRNFNAVLDFQQADGDDKELQFAAESVYSRLIIHNLCYKTINADLAEFREYLGYRTRAAFARSVDYFEIWKETDFPVYTYTFRLRDDSLPERTITLAELLKNADKSVMRLGNIEFHDYTYIACKDNPPLGAPGSEFAHAARPGEGVEVFQIYLTQIPDSRDPRYAYKNYPILVLLNDYPICRTRSDDKGWLNISLPKGTQGRLRISGPAFRDDPPTEYRLHEEWAPFHFFTAKGGETVYRIPDHPENKPW